MTRSLRQRHRVIIGALSLVLPIAFAGGIAARRSIPTSSVPPGLRTTTLISAPVLWTSTELFPGQQIIGIVRGETNSALAIELMVRDPIGPDVLVYWAPGGSAVKDKLPADVELLGVLSRNISLEFPSKRRGEAGRLVLYSLANHQITSVSKVFTIQQN